MTCAECTSWHDKLGEFLNTTILRIAHIVATDPTLWSADTISGTERSIMDRVV